MSPIDFLQAIAGLFILFFVPGYTLTIALFPRKGELDKEYDLLYKIALGIGMSIVLTILTGFALNSLGTYQTESGAVMGYVQAPYILAAIIGQSLFYFVIGWYRGGYPFMGKIHPSLTRVPKPEPGMIELPPGKEKYLDLLEKLGKRREILLRNIKDYERRTTMGTETMREHYERKLKNAKEELANLNNEIVEFEKKISEGIY